MNKTISPYVMPGINKKTGKASKSFRLDPVLLSDLQERADKENRSLNDLVETFLMISEINAHRMDQIKKKYRNDWGDYDKINETLNEIVDEEKELNNNLGY